LLRGWLHVLGAVALAGACPVLFASAKTWEQVGWVACFVVGVEAMFITSALFHRVRWSPSKYRAFKRADHAVIFLTITGCYLAIAGLTLHGRIRLVLITIVVVGAVVGAVIREMNLDTPKLFNTAPYIVVGWAAVAVLPQIYRGGGPFVFILIFASGISYTAGAIIFGLKRPQLVPHVFGPHELFHAGTVIGAGLSFWAIELILR